MLKKRTSSGSFEKVNNTKNENQSTLEDIEELFSQRIDFIMEDSHCLKDLADKLLIKIKDEKINNDNMIKEFKKYETIESDILKLNVGGTLFSTLKSTMTKQIKDKEGTLYPPNMFESLINGFVKPRYDENKAIFVDRNPKYFECILDYLRMANTDCEYELNSSVDKNQLLKEAKFYNIQGLVGLIEPEIFLANLSFDSLILNNNDLKRDLFNICQLPYKTKLNLLYRGSRDGYVAKNFHSKCDNIKKTLIIIKSNNNYIFGGYTEKFWNGNTEVNDPTAYIFSINYKSKVKTNKINCDQNYGPHFSANNGFFIMNDSKNCYNSCQLNNQVYFAGSNQYSVSEIEVYSFN